MPDMEHSLNTYLLEIIAYLKDNSLLISDSMSSVTLSPPGHTPSQDPPEDIYRRLTATSGTIPKEFRSPPGHLTIIQ